MIEASTAVSALVGAIAVSSLVMAVLALLAYRRARRGRFALVAGAFLVLLGRSLWTIWALFAAQSWESIFVVVSSADALLILLLYLAVIR
jgi:hypothetical protein